MPDPFVLLEPGTLDTRRAGEVVPLDAGVAKHLRTVLRLRAGSPIVVADGVGTSAPATLTDQGARLEADVTTDPGPDVPIEVLQGLAKGRKVDDVVRVLTEMGVDALTPVEADRSLVKLEGPKRDKALERWTAVARAAGEQSRRARTLQVTPPATVAELCAAGFDGALVLVAHVGAEGGLREALADVAAHPRVVVAVGPEGGWTDAEVDALAAAGARVVTLGRSVLRTEHAAPALAAVVAFTLGRMG